MVYTNNNCEMQSKTKRTDWAYLTITSHTVEIEFINIIESFQWTYRLFSEWWIANGCTRWWDDICWCHRWRCWFCASLHVGRWTKSSPNLWSRRRFAQIFHYLWSARGLRTILRVSKSDKYCKKKISTLKLWEYFRNMRRPVTHWYTKDQPIFENTEEMVDCRIDVTRIPGGADTPPCMKISHNTFETMEKANWEFLRLSLPVTCDGAFIE